MLNMRELMPWSRGREPATARRFEHPLMAFQKEVDRLFDEFWRAVDLPTALRGERIDMISPPRTTMPYSVSIPQTFGSAIRGRYPWRPTNWRDYRIDETETEIAVRAELPGMEEKDVELTLSDNMLTIQGEKKLTKEEKERGYTYAECSYGSFERRIPLEVEVDADRVAASFKNGVRVTRRSACCAFPPTGQAMAGSPACSHLAADARPRAHAASASPICWPKAGDRLSQHWRRTGRTKSFQQPCRCSEATSTIACILLFPSSISAMTNAG